MITTNAFDYINVLDKAADASWLRETAIMNNLANTDTPGYKRQDRKSTRLNSSHRSQSRMPSSA